MSFPNPYAYSCTTGYEDCPFTCVGDDACEKCPCTPLFKGGGPWGQAMDVIMCLLPIAYLLYGTLKAKPIPTTTSLPVSAGMMFLICVMYLGNDPLQACASVISGVHEAITPLTIMAGAIFLFETMEATGCMPWMMREMKILTKGHPIAEIMLIGCCFAYMVEGASGFGTPAALAAPMLASMGHGKFEAVVCVLLMNTIATPFGAVGTPIWFGLGSVGLTPDELKTVGLKTAIIVGITAFALVPMFVRILVPFPIIKRNIVFLMLSLGSCVGPAIGIATFSYDFPSLLGGMAGCFITALLINFNIGLNSKDAVVGDDKDSNADDDEFDGGSGMELGGGAAAGVLGDVSGIDTTGGGGASTVSGMHAETAEDNKEEGALGSGGGGGGGGGSITIVAPAAGTSVKQRTHNSSSTSKNNKTSSKTTTTSSDNTDFGAVKAKGVVGGSGVEEEGSAFRSVHFEERDQESIRESIRKLPPRPTGMAYYRQLMGRTFPLWGVVLLLILTRVQTFGIKDLLTRQEPAWEIQFGSYGIFKLSASLVFMLKSILTVGSVNWKYELLYIPFIIPFILVSGVTMLMYRKELTVKPMVLTKGVLGRLKGPTIALLGALVLVQLLRNGGEASPAYLIGSILSSALQQGWLAIAFYIGALGSFFSGSTTVSNLTFADVQLIAADEIGISDTSMLALQVAGATAGNAVCINNIISASTVIGLVGIGEGQIIARTGPLVGLFGVIATCLSLALFIRF